MDNVAALDHRDGVATGHDGLGTTKVRSGALEGVSAGQVACASPFVGQISLHPFDGIVRDITREEHDFLKVHTGVDWGVISMLSLANMIVLPLTGMLKVLLNFDNPFWSH